VAESPFSGDICEWLFSSLPVSLKDGTEMGFDLEVKRKIT
jgi:hypothetical protein